MRLLTACLFWLAATAVHAQRITSAEYDEPTTRYAHGVLGDAVEWGNMVVKVRREKGKEVGLLHGHLTFTYHLRLPEEAVYEDLSPRLVDLDGDNSPEIIVVESHKEYGARLAVYGLNADGVPAIRSWTRYIGQRNRWLAPVGAADFDGDGVTDIALVDRPHLARTLRVFPYQEGLLDKHHWLKPLTNHRIGDDYIEGGVRDCAGRPEMVLLNPGWNEIMIVDWRDGAYRSRKAGPYRGRSSVDAVLACR